MARARAKPEGSPGKRDEPEIVWPEHPVLREAAEALETCRFSGEVYDHKWRAVFASTELISMMGLDREQMRPVMGLSHVVRHLEQPEMFGATRESAIDFQRRIVPIMRHDVPPEDPDFDAVFGTLADLVRTSVEPRVPPPVTSLVVAFETNARRRDLGRAWLGETAFLFHRLHDAEGGFAGTLSVTAPFIAHSLAARLARGDISVWELMESLREPRRRPAAILFVDVESSGTLSRSLSSVAYFKLIRSMRDLIDRELTPLQGVVGKHAGDGASALFLTTEHGPAAESGAARRAIEAARAIRSGAAALWPEGTGMRLNIGLHWGATLTVGQISTMGRLDVTAMGDEMNECARIESAATEGAVLASKNLIERLTAEDAAALGLDPDEIVYRTVAELVPDGKVARDAGQIAVTSL